MASWGLLKCIKTKLQTTCFHLTLSFPKNKKRSGTSLPTYFLHNFWRKTFLLLYFINWPNSTVWLPLLWEILDNMCISLFLISLFPIWPKSRDKNVLRTKKLLKGNKKHLSSFLKGCTIFFGRWRSDFKSIFIFWL